MVGRDGTGHARASRHGFSADKKIPKLCFAAQSRKILSGLMSVTSLKSYRDGRETRVTTNQSGTMAKSVDIACREDAKRDRFWTPDAQMGDGLAVCKRTKRRRRLFTLGGEQESKLANTA